MENITKKCNVCGIDKPLVEFNKHSECLFGVASTCKKCNGIKRQEYNLRVGYAHYKKYEKTPKGFIMRMYRNMKSRITGIQKDKFHLYCGKEILTKEEFYAWALEHEQFKSLYKNYVNSNYDRKLAPSVDRIDSSLGYVINNMEWVTHSENSRRGSLSKARNKNKQKNH